MYSGTAGKVLEHLQSLPYCAQVKPGHYRSSSPIRAGSDGNTFALTLQDNEHGAYYDHKTQESGTLYELAKLLKIDLPNRQEVETTKKHYKNLEEYAQAHGVPAQAYIDAGWREVDHRGRPALEIPTRSGPRWRFLDGKKPRFKSVTGYQRCWYGLTVKTSSRIIREKLPLVIGNGEPSVVAAHHWGVPAAAITGGESGSIPSSLMSQLLEFLEECSSPPVLIALDCDPQGRRAARAMLSQIKKSGYENVRAIDLKLTSGGDLADYCMLHQDAAAGGLSQLADLAAGVEMSEKRRILPVKEVKKLPPVRWIVPGEIPRDGISLLYGPSGAGKSFFALDYALNLGQSESILYIAAEGQGGYRQRVEAWEKHHSRGADDMKLWFVMDPVNLMDNDDVEDFVAEVSHMKPTLVIVDTLAMCMLGGDENSARDIGKVVTSCKNAQKVLGCSWLLVHHTNKGRIAERGSSALRAACDCMIRLAPEDDIIRVSCAKTKDARPFETRYKSLLEIDLSDDGSTSSAVIVDADNVVQTNNDHLTTYQRQVLDMVGLGMGKDEIVNSEEIPRATAYRAINRLIDLGYLSETANDLQVTDLGQRKLKEASSLKNLTSLSETGASVQNALFQSHISLSETNETEQRPSYYDAGL